MRLLRKDGKYRWFLVKCISVEVVEQGRKWFGTCTDINDQKLLEHKLKEAHDAAQKSTESKTRFLSNMSHGTVVDRYVLLGRANGPRMSFPLLRTNIL